MDNTTAPAAPNTEDLNVLRANIMRHISQINLYVSLLRGKKDYSGEEVRIVASMFDYFANIKGQLETKLNEIDQGVNNVNQSV